MKKLAVHDESPGKMFSIKHFKIGSLKIDHHGNLETKLGFELLCMWRGFVTLNCRTVRQIWDWIISISPHIVTIDAALMCN